MSWEVGREIKDTFCALKAQRETEGETRKEQSWVHISSVDWAVETTVEIQREGDNFGLEQPKKRRDFVFNSSLPFAAKRDGHMAESLAKCTIHPSLT